MLNLLSDPPRYLFFTGKGGVGKTSLACAAALAMADVGKSVLLVSTDPASNLDEMLGQKLSDHPSPITDAPGLSALNIDPTAAAEAYIARVIAQMGDGATEEERTNVREELSGACTIEIAAFDEFVGLLADDTAQFDHVIFDTAPTGHTLRLLSIAKAWTGFLQDNDRGASCLGPHSGLKMQEGRFRDATVALADSQRTVFVLVTRPEKSALVEAARTSSELKTLGLGNQCLVVNGMFHATGADDKVAKALEELERQALAQVPEALLNLPRDEVPLRAFDMVGLQALRALLSIDKDATCPPIEPVHAEVVPVNLPGLDRMVDEIAATGRGLIMVMGKRGVGKTTVAAACAVGLVERGYEVHLSTTDPAAHLAMTLEGNLPGCESTGSTRKPKPVNTSKKSWRRGARNLTNRDALFCAKTCARPALRKLRCFTLFREPSLKRGAPL
jgi:arsenite-transporting ATPase